MLAFLVNKFRRQNNGESRTGRSERRYDGSFDGETIYEYFGNLVIKSHNIRDGHPVAIKFKTMGFFWESEADMMAYAHSQNLLAPAVWECRQLDSHRIAMIADFVPGNPLDEVWPTLDEQQRMSITEQLADHLKLFRSCTQPYIGRVNRQPTYNPYEGIERKLMGPFESEAAFDRWCLSRIKNTPENSKWTRKLAELRRKSPSKFVLTHGDLFPRNILVKEGKITGIVDWERSGFYPEYVEYALVACLYDYAGEEWWKPLLMEALTPCSPERLEVQSLIYSMSSILSASSQTVEYAPQTLHLVAFGIGDIAHWALFIPNRMADPTGTLVHIGIEGNDAKSGGGEAKLLINQFQVSRSSAKSVVPLVGSHATRGEVEDAARACFKSFNYNILLDNCQTFTIDVLIEL